MKKKITPVRVFTLFVIASIIYIILSHTIHFIQGIINFIAIHKSDNSIIYNNQEYIKTPFSPESYDMDKKLGTLREARRNWWIFWLRGWDEVYSIEGDDKEQFLVVTMHIYTDLYCQVDIKDKLKSKDGWNYTVGDVTGVKLESINNQIIYVTESDQIAYLQNIISDRTSVTSLDQNKEYTYWKIFYSYQNIPLYNRIGNIYKVDDTFIVKSFKKYYSIKDDGMLRDILSR